MSDLIPGYSLDPFEPAPTRRPKEIGKRYLPLNSSAPMSSAYENLPVSQNVDIRPPSQHPFLDALVPGDMTWEQYKTMLQHPLTPYRQLFPGLFLDPNSPETLDWIKNQLRNEQGPLAKAAGLDDIPDPWKKHTEVWEKLKPPLQPKKGEK